MKNTKTKMDTKGNPDITNKKTLTINLEEDFVETTNEPSRKRVKPTIYDHISHYDKLLEMINTEIDHKSRTKENGVRVLQKTRKIIETMKKELPYVTRSKEAKLALSKRKNVLSGFTIKYYVSQELADFLKIDPSTDTVSRVEVTRAICVYIHLKPDEKRENILIWKYLNPKCKRNLQNPDNRKTILPDKSLCSLFQCKQYKSQKTGRTETAILDYTSIQSLINHHFLESVKNRNKVD